MTDFDLVAVLDRALDSSNEPAPVDVARNALLRIPLERREEALIQALTICIESRLYERQGEPD